MPLLLVALLAALQAPAPVTAPAAPPRWLTRPSAEDVKRAYPAGARNISGRSAIKCTVDVSGHMKDCVIVEETPAGRGFGNAHLRLAPKFTMTPPTRSDGTTIEDATITIPVRWSPG